MRYAYHADYFVPLPTRHPFPMAKYPLTYQRLLGEGVLQAQNVIVPDEAPAGDLALVQRRVPAKTRDRVARGGRGPPHRRPVVGGALAPVEAGGAGNG